MGKIGKALGFGDLGATSMDDSTGDESVEDPTDEAPKDAEAEVTAMKLFMKASTAEAKASAMRDFLEACGY